MSGRLVSFGMKAQRRLAETETPGGGRLALYEHDGTYAIRMNGQGLMQSTATASEMVLGELGTAHLDQKDDARILIGGLGLGFTLKSVLERVPQSASVLVAELIPDVVQWNRDFLQSLNGTLLDDPRVEVLETDVNLLLKRNLPAGFDAILLDIDNGPSSMVQEENTLLYSNAGIGHLKAALRPKGRAVIWSAGEDPAFEKRLRRAGFSVKIVRAKRYAGARRATIILYVADKTGKNT